MMLFHMDQEQCCPASWKMDWRDPLPSFHCYFLLLKKIDKEAATLVFGVKKFHQYLHGRPFKLYTNHNPLLGDFKGNKRIAEISSARIQRWNVILAACTFQLVYRENKQKNGNDDSLSRLILPTNIKEVPMPEEYFMLLEYLDQTLITYDEIARWTRKDTVLTHAVLYSTWMA